MKPSFLFAGICLGILGCAEIAARYVLGLGTPPLTTPHPTIEYMFQPNQDVNRFGNRQAYNQFGMRSAALPGSDKTEIVLVIGDSVINGGNLTDQADLATTIATREDADRFYANISAGSWGPGNQLAYLEEFGTFGATAAVLVLNTGDLDDIPKFDPLDPMTHPLQPPLSALGEGITRYLPRYLPELFTDWLRPGFVYHPYQHSSPDMAGSDYLVGLFSLLARADIPVCILLHGGLDEQSKSQPHSGIKELATQSEVPVIDTLPLLSRNGRDPVLIATEI